MQKNDYEKHNEYVMNLPRWKLSERCPVVIGEYFFDKILELGEYEEYKNDVIVSQRIPLIIDKI